MWPLRVVCAGLMPAIAGGWTQPLTPSTTPAVSKNLAGRLPAASWPLMTSLELNDIGLSGPLPEWGSAALPMPSLKTLNLK